MPETPITRLGRQIAETVVAQIEARDISALDAVTALVDALANLIASEPRRSMRRTIVRTVREILGPHVDRRVTERLAMDPAYRAAVLRLNPVHPPQRGEL